MKTRPMKIEDIPALEAPYRDAGFDYGMPNLLSKEIEDATVVTDEDGSVVAAAIAKRSVELYLIMGKAGHLIVKMERIQSLHTAMCENLKQKGFTEGNCFLPPEIAKSYGRHLMKWFGWLKNNQSYAIRG